MEGTEKGEAGMYTLCVSGANAAKWLHKWKIFAYSTLYSCKFGEIFWPIQISKTCSIICFILKKQTNCLNVQFALSWNLWILYRKIMELRRIRSCTECWNKWYWTHKELFLDIGLGGKDWSFCFSCWVCFFSWHVSSIAYNHHRAEYFIIWIPIGWQKQGD